MATEGATELIRVIPHAFREVLLLEKAQAAVASRSVEQQQTIAELSDAIDARMAAADSLSAGDQTPAALVLLRDATLLAIRVVLVNSGRTVSEPTLDGAFADLAPLIESGRLTPPAGFDRVRALLTDKGHLAFDELDARDASSRRSEVEATVGWLRKQVDSRTVSQIKVSRVFRVASIAIVILGVVVWSVGWGVSKAMARKNLARGKPVQASSRRADVPAGSGPLGLSPAGLTDGSKGSAYDNCTNFEVNPWVMVDLERPQPVSSIKVYNRGDCCWGSHDLPVVLEVSADGTTFTEVARRTTAYTASDPWVVSTKEQAVRFIKVRAEAPDPRELVLNEIEAF